MVASGSEGVGGQKQPMAERALASGKVGVWDGSGFGDCSDNPLFVDIPLSGTVEASGTAILYFWFFPNSVGGFVGVGSAVELFAVARGLALGGDNFGNS